MHLRQELHAPLSAIGQVGVDPAKIDLGEVTAATRTSGNGDLPYLKMRRTEYLKMISNLDRNGLTMCKLNKIRASSNNAHAPTSTTL